MRLDSYLFEKGFAQSRNKAAELIKEGSVWVNGKVERKSSVEIGDNDTVDVEKITQYVSRAGLKLRGFINELSLHVKGVKSSSHSFCKQPKMTSFPISRKNSPPPCAFTLLSREPITIRLMPNV